MRKIKIKNIEFFVDDKDYKDFWNIFGDWEQDSLDFIQYKGKEDEIFVDVGAWIGPYTLIAAKMGMKVYSFEPDKLAFKVLNKNISLNSFKHKPQTFNFALSNSEKRTYLYSNSNIFGKSESSLINYKNKKNNHKIYIEVKNFLDELNKIKNQNPNHKIEILKIDIEGGEFFIEKDIYKFVNKNKLFCLLSYHHMVFNNNKIKKFFYKVRTLFFQLSVNKLYPSKKIHKITNIFSNS
jgi:FkbM family methyltransferase|tara:strand:- start:354 stop:1064 length:711 start_codon:yes stop_codon:yes gene_type:complete